jgi:hypothetical protein
MSQAKLMAATFSQLKVMFEHREATALHRALCTLVSPAPQDWLSRVIILPGTWVAYPKSVGKGAGPANVFPIPKFSLLLCQGHIQNFSSLAQINYAEKKNKMVYFFGE